MGRWDHLFDLKPKPIADHLLDEVAALLSQDLVQWPPAVLEWISAAEQSRFAPLFVGGAPRPGLATFEEAFRLARWEMQRDVLAIDAYMTETKWRSAGISDSEFLALLFLHQWLVEQMLSLNEVTGGRVKRPQLDECLVRTERRFLQMVRESWNPAARS
jgi:hypothetical protein